MTKDVHKVLEASKLLPTLVMVEHQGAIYAELKDHCSNCHQFSLCESVSKTWLWIKTALGQRLVG